MSTLRLWVLPAVALGCAGNGYADELPVFDFGADNIQIYLQFSELHGATCCNDIYGPVTTPAGIGDRWEGVATGTSLNALTFGTMVFTLSVAIDESGHVRGDVIINGVPGYDPNTGEFLDYFLLATDIDAGGGGSFLGGDVIEDTPDKFIFTGQAGFLCNSCDSFSWEALFTLTAITTPEPGIVWLLGGGLALLAGTRWVQRRIR